MRAPAGRHREPEVGAAPRFKGKAAPATYRYDSSLARALDWDTNLARETARFLLACIEDGASLPAPHEFGAPRKLKGADAATLLRIGGLQDTVAALKRMQALFLNSAGKAERASFGVPTLPLFVHELLSKAATHEEPVWQHLAGDMSAPIVAPVGTDIAVKVIDERRNELPVIRRLG